MPPEIEMVNTVSQEDIRGYKQALRKLQAMFKKHLMPENVSWPSVSQSAGLTLLYQHFGVPVSKDAIAVYVRKVLSRPKLSGDQQLRHLRAKGWYINGSGRGSNLTNCLQDGSRVPKGTYVLLSVTTPHPLWLSERRMTRAEGPLLARTFNDLLAYYEFRCAMCGKSLLSGADKGHKDPRKEPTLDNTIPLCSACNNWQADRVVLDDKGRVCAILDPAFVINAGPDIQEKVLNALLALRKDVRPQSQ